MNSSEPHKAEHFQGVWLQVLFDNENEASGINLCGKFHKLLLMGSMTFVNGLARPSKVVTPNVIHSSTGNLDITFVYPNINSPYLKRFLWRLLENWALRLKDTCEGRQPQGLVTNWEDRPVAASPIIAALINSYGCRAVAIGGATLSSGALLLSAFMNSIGALFITFGIVGGSAFGAVYLPAVISVNIYFNRKRALANGIATIGSPVGAILFGPVTGHLLQIYQWSNTLVIFAGLLLNCIAFGCLYRPLKPTATLKPLSATYLPEELEAIKIEDVDTSGIFANESIRASQSIFLSNGRIVKPLIQFNEAMEIESDNLSDVPCVPGTMNDENDNHHVDIPKTNAPGFLSKAAEKTRRGLQPCHSPNLVKNDTTVREYKAFKGRPTERKIEMAILDSKPTLVLLPHPEITINDYRRPFYRSDIFYE
ncbi:uncharacterized protein DEA37_0002303 [Paragonimus westermani]|uniref:Major facilitator superfamily (MFS) profile domain-containing protein n=1 Tax=Paragonimus westermani TaxID=34504 RepID=A0A5J4NKR3_9TREM|nr:uncharacterized protein DEA37_0002303 [Paragonimus westermani]